MIKERCYFMAGVADGLIVDISPHSTNVRVPGLVMTTPNNQVNHQYMRTQLTHSAPHPLHGMWPVTVYALVERL